MSSDKDSDNEDDKPQKPSESFLQKISRKRQEYRDWKNGGMKGIALMKKVTVIVYLKWISLIH